MPRLCSEGSRSYLGRPALRAVRRTTGAGLRPTPKGMEKPPDPTVRRTARDGAIRLVMGQGSAEGIVPPEPWREGLNLKGGKDPAETPLLRRRRQAEQGVGVRRTRRNRTVMTYWSECLTGRTCFGHGNGLRLTRGVPEWTE